MSKKQINFEEITLRLDYSHRGGGVEIALDTLGYPDAKMAAYQNYLGGGMLGAIQSDCTLDYVSDETIHRVKLGEIAEQLKKYFHNLTNHSEDKWEKATFEENQKRPTSAY